MHSYTQLTLLLQRRNAWSLSRQPLCHTLWKACRVLFQSGPLRQCGVLRLGARGPFLMACGVNTCGSEGLPRLRTAHITSLFLSRTKHQELQHVRQLFPLQISIASSARFTWNSSEQRTSRKMELEMPSQTAVLTLLMEI